MKPKHCIAGLALLAALVSSLAACGYTRGNVQGTVTDSSGQPLGGVMVQLYGVEEASPMFLKSADDGSFEFRDVLTGTWTLECYDSDGNLAGRETVEVEAGETATADFVMG